MVTDKGKESAGVGWSGNLRDLVQGDQIRLEGDIIAEVVNNPKDGLWIRAKFIRVPGEPAQEGTEGQVFLTQVEDKIT